MLAKCLQGAQKIDRCWGQRRALEQRNRMALLQKRLGQLNVLWRGNQTRELCRKKSCTRVRLSRPSICLMLPGWTKRGGWHMVICAQNCSLNPCGGWLHLNTSPFYSILGAIRLPLGRKWLTLLTLSFNKVWETIKTQMLLMNRFSSRR